jgi:hypothetical protein
VLGVAAAEALVLPLLVACCAVGCMRSAGPAPQPAMASPTTAARTAVVLRVDVVRLVGINQFPLGPSMST